MATTDQGGVWRTINGYHVFIKDGQSASEAIAEQKKQQKETKTKETENKPKEAITNKPKDPVMQYESEFKLESPVNDFDAAQAYLSDDDMTQYLPDELKEPISSVEWQLDDDETGRVVVKTNRELTEDEAQSLKDWIDGQNSDGLGEGFEQQEFATSYWNPETGEGPFTYREFEREQERMYDELEPYEYADYLDDYAVDAAVKDYMEAGGFDLNDEDALIAARQEVREYPEEYLDWEDIAHAKDEYFKEHGGSNEDEWFAMSSMRRNGDDFIETDIRPQVKTGVDNPVKAAAEDLGIERGSNEASQLQDILETPEEDNTDWSRYDEFIDDLKANKNKNMNYEEWLKEKETTDYLMEFEREEYSKANPERKTELFNEASKRRMENEAVETIPGVWEKQEDGSFKANKDAMKADYEARHKKYDEKIKQFAEDRDNMTNSDWEASIMAYEKQNADGTYKTMQDIMDDVQNYTKRKSPVVQSADLIGEQLDEIGNNKISETTIRDYVYNDVLDDELRDYNPKEEEFQALYKELENRGYKIEYDRKSDQKAKETYMSIPQEERVKAYEEGKNWKDLVKEKTPEQKTTDSTSLSKDDIENDLRWFEEMENKYPSDKGLKENTEYQALKEDWESATGKKWNSESPKDIVDRVNNYAGNYDKLGQAQYSMDQKTGIKLPVKSQSGGEGTYYEVQELLDEQVNDKVITAKQRDIILEEMNKKSSAKSISDNLSRAAYNKYLKEHPGSKITFEDFKKKNK